MDDSYYFHETSRLWEERENARKRHREAVANEEAARRKVDEDKAEMNARFKELDMAAKKYKAAWATYDEERLIGNLMIKLYEKDAEVERVAIEEASNKSRAYHAAGDYAASKRYWLAVEAHQMSLDEFKRKRHEAIESNKRAFSVAQSVPRYSNEAFRLARCEFLASCQEYDRARKETQRCWVDFNTACDKYYRLRCEHLDYRSEHAE